MTAAEHWYAERTFHHSAYSVERLVAEREATISVCVPARETAATIAGVLAPVIALRERGVVEQVLVVDADSSDGTARVAAQAGAEVVQEGELLPDFGPVLGKGDAMWRALTALTGDVVVFLDSDSEQAGDHYVCGLAGPIVCAPGADFVKACYRRPFRSGDVVAPTGGGRVNELVARPLLNAFYPELAGVLQPLAGEVAARRELLERLSFATGYAVEIAMLIDAWREVGLAGIAQVDLDVHQNQHQSLSALGAMAYSVLRAVSERLAQEGRLAEAPGPHFLQRDGQALHAREVEFVERPALVSVRS